MIKLLSFSPSYSTTRLGFKLLDEKYLTADGNIKEELKFNTNILELSIKKSKLIGKPEEVKYLGYIPDEDTSYFYKLATTLVMPTLFESVSMPMEAFYLGCPVATSNVCALPKQVSKAGLLFDPKDIEYMTEKIYRIWIDENLRKELIQKRTRKG